MADPAAVLVAARDEESTIATTVAALLEQFPGAEVIVADDGSRDATAALAEQAGARVLRLPRSGKGQALTLAEVAAPPGSIVLADADLVGDLRPLLAEEADLAVAAAVPDAVHRVNGVAVVGQPPPQGVVEAEVLGVAV